MTFLHILPGFLLGLSSIGIAAGSFYAEPRSPTTRALALALFANGWEWIETPWVFWENPLPGLRYFDLLLIMGAGSAFAEWLYRVARTAEASPRAMSVITRSVRLIQVSCGLALLWGWAHIDATYEKFFNGSGASLGDPVVLPFAVGLSLVVVCYVIAGVVLFLQRIDPVERIRALALALAMPFICLGLVAPSGMSDLSNMAGQVVLLIGVIQYHAMQGERGRFMSKFLSPEVERLVRFSGMTRAMQPQSLEITAVECDLRGFTRYAQSRPSEEVVGLLAEYYAAVGAVVAKYGATIKDYAGDGILMLVGAPLPVADHARIGLDLARGVVEAATVVVRKRATAEIPLGVGAGVASGRVIAGGIGSASRMEYAAVGPAVNLAARLCSIARDGEVLADERTAELARSVTLVARGTVPVKGVGDVPHFALA